MPAFHEEFEPSFVERYLPRSFTQGYGRSYMWWSWFVMLCAALAAYIIAVASTRGVGSRPASC